MTHHSPSSQTELWPHFSAPYAEDDVVLARKLIHESRLASEREQRIDTEATRLIDAIRTSSGSFGGVEDMLREYALSTKEGLALMILAEALLRVPDAETADRLIEDKLGQGDFAGHRARSDAFLVSASSWALALTARIIHPGETPDGIVGQLVKRIGLPAVRTATRQAMRVMGGQFVLGETIQAALKRTRSGTGRLYRYSFDMLGEGARTADDAGRYWQAYADSIDVIGADAGSLEGLARPGISIKLSALHPHYEALNRKRVLTELAPRILELARKAKAHDLTLTIDAEEADRLELSLDLIAAIFRDPSLKGWDGFGMAVQAYLKRAGAVIDYAAGLCSHLDRRMTLRLVKGAYWDTELKRAQERGLADYPVFTRKAMTDLNYLACAQKLLALRPRLYPQFATHNALTAATIIELAGGVEGYEFQRLHGMGEALYTRLFADHPEAACRIYAPVGIHKDLLAYLVRRLLENGANSSFVAAAADKEFAIADLLKKPADIIGRPEAARHARIPLPRDLYGNGRINSKGVEFGCRAELDTLLAAIDAERGTVLSAHSLIDGAERPGTPHSIASPVDGKPVGTVTWATMTDADAAMASARQGFRDWSATPPKERAACLRRAADRLGERYGLFAYLLQYEAGKTIDDAVSELREAIDFCRFYAAQGETQFGNGALMPGPTGESNLLTLRGRGVFVAISPWNFPLAIFLGQIAAALMAGNAVVAKPAEQTPLIAWQIVRLLHEAGIPTSALHLLPGDGAIGAHLVDSPYVDGVVFTGSTDVARSINRALARKSGPIVPMIAETGGINAMIVDATALPEQVTDDVIASAFRSAGQRCSALRLLCIQEDVADRMIAMIIGATKELALGDPRRPETQIGPVIDTEAKKTLDAHIAQTKQTARLHYAGTAPLTGSYVAPHIFEISSAADLTHEVFGPVLHIVRYPANRLNDILDTIDKTGFALTLGVHSRIDATVEKVVSRLKVGNIYINRNMIGAVVGVQPFGGSGLSGTGPKAGGPHYLPRFATEQTLTINTAAAGGNAALIAMSEE